MPITVKQIVPMILVAVYVLYGYIIDSLLIEIVGSVMFVLLFAIYIKIDENNEKRKK